MGIHAAVGEADEVGETVISEYDREVAVFRCKTVGTIEHVGVLDGAAFVAMEEVFERPTENGFVGANPANSFFSNVGQDFWADGLFRGPESTQGSAEAIFVHFAGFAEMTGDVIGVPEALFW